MKNILLIEYNWFHDEVIIPQLEILCDQNCFLLANKKWLEKGTWSLFSQDKASVNALFVHKRSRKYLRKIDNVRRVIIAINIILKRKIGIVIFNTLDIYNEDILLLIKLIKLLKLQVKILGIVHNAEKIENYSNLVDKIFVISSLVKKHHSADGNVDCFYPLLYKYKNNIVQYLHDDEFRITIPGNIEYSRREYNFLYQFAVENEVFLENNGIKFIILGNYTITNDGKDFYNLILNAKLGKYFKFFDYLIPYSEYMEVICSSQLIMPLIHPETEKFDNYLKDKVSASFNMSFSTNIPLLMHEKFKGLGEFDDFSVWYHSKETLKSQIVNLLTNKKDLSEISMNIKNENKFSKDFQIVKFL